MNTGLGRPWDIFFQIDIFIMLQKNGFGPKKIKFHAWVQKCHFGEIEKMPKRQLWTLAWKGKIEAASFFLPSKKTIQAV